MMRDAQARGVAVVTDCRVRQVEIGDGRVRALVTDHGRVECETLIVAAGIWSPLIARLAGVNLPLTPMMHQYAVSAIIPELSDQPMPNVRDPDHLIYARQRKRQLIFGGYERTPATFDSVRRIPALAAAPPLETVCGLESFTIDGEFLLGPAPDLPNFWSACGFCAHGVSSAGGIGKALAEWIVHGEPGFDLAHMSLSRFAGQMFNVEETRSGARRVYGTYYDLPAQT
jgi:4-methylaminobutanoate oxidase (formaldehyde-forming)